MLTLPPPPNKDEIITVSPSQLDVWYKCRYHWSLSYKRGFTTGSSLALMRGTIIHRLMQMGYDFAIENGYFPTDSSTLFGFRQTLEAEYTDISSLTILNWAFVTFCRYSQFAAKNDDFTPLDTEVELFAPTDLVGADGKQVYLHGILDLPVDRDGDIGVVDHKSYYQERGRWTSDMVYFDQQLAFYMLMLHMLDLTPTFGMINGINTFEYKTPPPDNKLFEREEVWHKPKRLLAYRDNIYASIEEMLTVTKFPKRLLKDCRYCGYKEVCDYELRGHNSETLLQVKHTRDTKPVIVTDPFEDDLNAT